MAGARPVRFCSTSTRPIVPISRHAPQVSWVSAPAMRSSARPGGRGVSAGSGTATVAIVLRGSGWAARFWSASPGFDPVCSHGPAGGKRPRGDGPVLGGGSGEGRGAGPGEGRGAGLGEGRGTGPGAAAGSGTPPHEVVIRRGRVPAVPTDGATREAPTRI